MPSFNRVTLMGNLTRDPQLKQLPSSTTVAEFGLAISRRFRTQTGDDREEVCFVDCTAFGRQADTIGQYCQKGRPLLVEGRLKYDAWEDKTGGKRSKLSVVVENFQFLGRQAEGEDDGPFGRQSMFGAQQTFEDRFAERRFREEDPFTTGGTAGNGSRPMAARAAQPRNGHDARPGTEGPSGSDVRPATEVRHGADREGATDDAVTADAAPADRPGHAADRSSAADRGTAARSGGDDREAAPVRSAGSGRPAAPVRSNLRAGRVPAKAGAGAGGEKARFSHEDIPF